MFSYQRPNNTENYLDYLSISEYEHSVKSVMDSKQIFNFSKVHIVVHDCLPFTHHNSVENLIDCCRSETHVVKGQTCRRAKDADSKFALAKDAKGDLQPTIYVTICVYK